MPDSSSVARGLPSGCKWRLYESTADGSVFTVLIEGLSLNGQELSELADVHLEGSKSVLHFSCQGQRLMLQLPRGVTDAGEVKCHVNRCMGSCSLSVTRADADELAMADPATHESTDEDTEPEQQVTSSDEEYESSDDMVDADYDALGLLAPGVAQLLNVVHIPNFLSLDEIHKLREVAALGQAEGRVAVVERGTDGRQLDGGVWQTSYLHTSGFCSQQLPELLQKIRAAVVRVDAENWQCLHGRDPSTIHFRNIELHEYKAGGGLRERRHYDSGSCITCDFMLNVPGQDFLGGSFVTPNKDGSVDRVDVHQGDALIFLSHKSFCSVS